MLFNSFEFLLFFPIVVLLYFMIPHKYRWILLLTASYYFYMCWKPEYIILIIASTLIDYFLALKMGTINDRKKRKKYLIVSLILNLTILFMFKYFNFFNISFMNIFHKFNLSYSIPNLNLLLPVGISFYTFQTLSYTIDVYRGTRKPEKHLGMFALYVSFFPQLVAGPIERSDILLPQFYKKHEFDYNRVTNGLKLMAWGFFKKVVIADRLALIVNSVYNNVTDYKGLPLAIASVLFTYQIYCDFSGYSDIAIGSAKVMGFDLMENFKRPYFSKSIAEFWNRWHISLSSWFRDYVYIPMGGNKVSLPKQYYNLLFTFVISGLWHGANWTFILWGALHGVYLIVSKMTYKRRCEIVKKIKLDEIPVVHKCIQIFTTFLLFTFSLIFFRANSVSDALYVVKNIFSDIRSWTEFSYIIQSIKTVHFDIKQVVFNLIFILIMEIIHLIQRKKSIRETLSMKPLFIRWLSYYLLILTIVLFGKFGKSEFIYFQF